MVHSSGSIMQLYPALTWGFPDKSTWKPNNPIVVISWTSMTQTHGLACGWLEQQVSCCKSLNAQGRYVCCKPDGEQVERKEDDLEKKAFKIQPRPAVGINNMEFFRKQVCEWMWMKRRGKVKDQAKMANLTLPCGFDALNNLKIQYHTPSFHSPLNSRHEHIHPGPQWACTQLRRLWSEG